MDILSPNFSMYHFSVTLVVALSAMSVSPQSSSGSSENLCNGLDIATAEKASKVIVSATVDRVQDENSVQVAIRRVMKGSSDLAGSIMIVKGLHAECELLRIGDIRYFFLNSVRPGVMVSVRPPLTVTLDHIDRLNAAIAAQLPPRRPTVSDLPCETKYCPNNQECHEHQGQASCRCPDSCPYDPNARPVCGSNNSTFTSHCRLRVDSCRRSERVWVRWAGSCDTPKDRHIHPFEMPLTSY
ncbi:agrin-like isoform X2 [Varroa jacobsoni]|uniref:Kazal-like domain-containing protein n=1 Tax=Varroa destructor TaxID=109461 RepID=A0A7M7KKN8_VARDE|nr:agrin-like isoform X2 [Varroa destructor]XP_022690712.1 agrin-like isoform X2 [Varroa jacobsoni]